jgi:hypothetical protein
MEHLARLNANLAKKFEQSFIRRPQQGDGDCNEARRCLVSHHWETEAPSPSYRVEFPLNKAISSGKPDAQPPGASRLPLS